MGAAARRKGFGVRPDQLRSVGRYADCRMRCWLSKENSPEVPHSSVSSKRFRCRHYPPTNAPRSPVRRSVPIPDKLPHGNPEGTNRLQNAQRQCSHFDKVTVTQISSTVTLFGVTGTRITTVTTLKQRRIDILKISGAGRMYDHPLQYFTVTTVTRDINNKLNQA